MTINVATDCGPHTVDFMMNDGLRTPVDPLLFEDFESATNEFRLLYTEDTSAATVYPITYEVSWTNYPSNSILQTTPFVVELLDPCDDPVSVTPSGLTDQEYTITQGAFDYVVPVYTADPLWCAIEYSYTISDTLGNSALTFDGSSRAFTFFNFDDLAPAGLDFQDYTIAVRGTSGNVIPVFGMTTFNLRLKNPCIDPAFIEVEIKDILPLGERYFLWTFSPSGYEFQHDSLYLAFHQTAPHFLCGPIDYSTTFMGDSLTTSTTPMRYNQDMQTFQIFSSDEAIVGFQTIEITSYLREYPGVQSATETTTIEIINSCLNPFGITAQN